MTATARAIEQRHDRDEPAIHDASIAQARRACRVSRGPVGGPGRRPVVGDEPRPPRPGQVAKVAGRKACRSTSRWASLAAASRAAATVAPSAAVGVDRGRRIERRQHRGDAQRLVVLGRGPGRPRVGRTAVEAGLVRVAARAGPRPVEVAEAPDEAPHRDAVRPVARLADGRLPAAGQPLAGTLAERLAEQVVEERRRGRVRWHSHRSRRGPRVVPRPPGRAAPRRPTPPLRARRAGRAAGSGRSWRRTRSASGRRRRGGRSRRHRAPRRDRGSERTPRRIGRPAPDGRGALRSAERGSRPPVVADRSPDATFAVVAAAQLRVAQPVVGDVDPLRPLEAVGPATSGWCCRSSDRQATSIDLRAGVARDLESGVQVVGGKRRAGRHRRNPSGAAAVVAPARLARDELHQPSPGGREAAAADQAQPAAGKATQHAPPIRPPRRSSVSRRAPRWAPARRGVTTVVERIDPGVAGRSHHQGDGAPGDDQQLAAREALAVPDLRGRHHRLDPARGHLRDQPARRFARGDDHRRDVVVRGAGRGAARRRRAVIVLDGTTLTQTSRSPRSGPPSPTRSPRTSTSSEERLDVLDRAGRPLAGRTLGDLDAAGRQRPRD